MANNGGRASNESGQVVLPVYTELQRDDEPHDQLASQDDMDRF